MKFHLSFQINGFLRSFKLWRAASSVAINSMKVLNVAEKNDAAKNIAYFLSSGNSQRREGFSKFNKIYEFQCNLHGQRRQMIMTSVSGHLLNFNFVGAYKNWSGCSPEVLFEAPIQKLCPENYMPIKRTLEKEAKSCDTLIIWTDCDREGENIGYEIISTCKAVNPRLKIFRAIFSEITGPSITRAIQNLAQPKKSVSDAVDVRSELDLRIGASFTRFQTLRLQKVFPVLAEYLLSYGSCQFPTLGFVVERYLERERFIPEPFWKLKVTHTKEDLTVEFRWQRDRLFDEKICEALLQRCQENSLAKVEKVDGKPKSKWRPTPLDTTEMEKLASRKLRLNAKETLKIAEKLYTQGYISYPRTETNIFPSSINLSSLVELQVEDPRWGNFARKVLDEGPNPRQGKKSDQSHPPIHPTKYTNSLDGNEARVYEFIVRHFLACVSKDAKGHETTVSIDINTEKFTASGLMILERNYLDVYPYENWNSKAIHLYKLGETFQPTSLEMVGSQTSAPNLLTEADLISLMEKHGIGTDATHAEHIETIKQRMYVGLEDNHFVPSAVGMGLVEGYNSMGFEMSKPKLRAELEADLKRICDGVRQPQDVLQEQIRKYRDLFLKAKEQVNKIDAAIGKYIQENAVQLNPEQDPMNVVMQAHDKVMPCQRCGVDMVLKRFAETNRIAVSCMGFPECKNTIWFPGKVLEAKVSDQTCFTCGPGVKMIDFRFRPGSMIPYYPDCFTGCLNGCDPDFLEMLEVRVPRPSESSTIQTQPVRNEIPMEERRRSSTGNERAAQNGPQRFNSEPFRMSSDGFGGNTRTGWDNGGGRGGGNSGQPRGQKRTRDDNDSNQGPAEGGDAEVSCLCGLPAKRLTTRKEGPNMGRDFYVCPKDTDEKCGYYSWADEISGVKCFCNLTCKKLTVRKEGPNQGKQFYSCPKPQNERCSFFLWDEGDLGEGGRAVTGRGGLALPRNNRPNNRNHTSTNFRARGNTQNSTRKCGLCGQTGHNRRNCPQNAGDS